MDKGSNNVVIMRRRFAGFVICLLAAVVMSGCATGHRLGDDFLTPEFRRGNYVEGVVRYSNDVGSRFIEFQIAADGLDEEYANTISQAEDRMVDACTYLVELVVLNREGRRPGTALKLKALATASACAEATRNFDDVLTSIGSVAGY